MDYRAVLQDCFAALKACFLNTRLRFNTNKELHKHIPTSTKLPKNTFNKQIRRLGHGRSGGNRRRKFDNHI